MNDKAEHDTLKDILELMVKEGDASAQSRAAGLLDQPDMIDTLEAVAELNPEHFDLLFNLPIRESTEALLDQCFTDDVLDKTRLTFLFCQSRFIENHLTRLFQQYEGTAKSAEKSRTLLRALAHFFATGQPIQFDYSDQQNNPATTLPETILTHHTAIYEFFEGLYRLHNGQPEMYLHQLGEILERT